MEQRRLKGTKPTDLFMFIFTTVGGLGTAFEGFSLLPSLFLSPSFFFFV